MHTERSSNIRALSRGLEVLRIINRYRSASLKDIAAQTQVPYPTASRIIHALLSEGLIERAGNRRYRPTALVQSLSVGYQAEDRAAAIARPHLAQLTTNILWPVYFSSRIGMNMVVKESTDTLTTLALAHRSPGYTMPLVESSSGKAFLAYTPEDQREIILASAMGRGISTRHELTRLRIELSDIGNRGYAAISRHPYTENRGKTSAISVPILSNDRALGSLSVLFFASTVSMTTALEAYLRPLQSTSRAISEALRMRRSTN